MMMKKAFYIFLSVVIILGISGIPLQAGQIVTDDMRAWARDALTQETGLEAESAGNTLAVLYFHNKSGDAGLNPLQKGLAFMLMTDLSQVDGIVLVERVKLQALVEEMDLGVSGLVAPDSAPRVGRLLGARFLVGGDLQGSKSELGIASDVLEVPGQRLAGSPLSEGDLPRIFEMEKELLFAIIDILRIELSEQKKLELEKPFTTKIDALYNLMYAIDSADRGDYLKAEAYYKEALKKDPGLNAAEEGLQELKDLNLVGPHDRSKAMAESLEERTSQTSRLTDDYISRRNRNPGDNLKTAGQIRVQW
ncbi:MAG TPA: CsgG/HfaB family protein [Deltaproteobacteria bacterium]|nr:CsgG/HfaB family protein [Deltaproteobacteria bacterium]HPR53064.1 CsgG/HfaB family protein [Deltaproteobacteria bacterium]